MLWCTEHVIDVTGSSTSALSNGSSDWGGPGQASAVFVCVVHSQELTSQPDFGCTMLQACASKFLVCCRRAGSFLQETVQQPHSTSLKGLFCDVLCRLRRSSGFSELCRAGGLNVECNMKTLRLFHVFWKLLRCSGLSLMTLTKRIPECCDSPRGWKPELSDRLQRYLLGDLFGEGAITILRVEMTCVCKSGGGIRTPKEFESNDRVRQFLEDLCAAESFAHPDNLCSSIRRARPKRGSSNANAVAEVGDEEDNYPCQFRTNQIWVFQFHKKFSKALEPAIDAELHLAWDGGAWYISWCTKARIVTTRRGRVQALKMKPRPCPKAKWESSARCHP